MRLTPRAFAGFALLSLALAGCGGDSGHQTTSSPLREFVVSSATVYGTDAPAVDTVRDARAEGDPIIPLATLNSAAGQTVVLWGTRDGTGKVTSVREAAYQDADVTLYARYGANGGILSVLGASAGTRNDPALQKNAGSYVTFGPLEESGNSIVGSGVVFENGAQKSTDSVRATLTDNGVTVKDLDESRTQVASLIARAGRSASRADGNDPLNGLSTVYQDAENRTKIISSLLKVAGIVVERPYSTYIANSSGFLFLDELAQSYQNYTAQGFEPGTASGATTPLPYRSDLP